MPDIKLATCNFCGKRTALRNTAHDGHELACGSCGAPLHVMKRMRAETAEVAAGHKPSKTPKPIKGKKKKGKRRWLKLAKDVIEEIGDILD